MICCNDINSYPKKIRHNYRLICIIGEGKLAFKKKLSISECPYTENTIEYDAWMFGYSS